MNWFHRRSIKFKLVWLFTLTATIALLMSFCLHWWIDSASFQTTLKREGQTLAQMLAESTSAALMFEDAKAANDALASLRGEPRVHMAALYTAQGKALAYYTANNRAPQFPPEPKSGGSESAGAYLVVSQPVYVSGERVGSVYLRISRAEIYIRLAHSAVMGAVVLLAAALVAILVGLRLQRVISGPILHLTGVAQAVTQKGCYSLRALKTTEDELGLLIDRFNEMMEQVHKRDVALKQAQDDLEERVRERTLELQNEIAVREVAQQETLNAKTAAEESNRAKSDFLANMSHELRTPLNAIIGYSEMLAEDAEEAGDQQTVADLGKIRKAGAHLLTLINDVLDLSKIEAGRMEVRNETVDLPNLVQEVAATVAPMARKNNNEFVVDLEESPRAVYLDGVKFRQSLLNLLSNACKFTENGKVTVEVRQQRVGGTPWFACRVQDTGIGISPENAKKLFRSFSQADTSTTRKFGGTGLGLAISQRFCQMMGGQITVESEPGHGSAFTIELPAIQPPEPA